ncbi:leucine-rich repeat domain-containing protein [Taibaiella koreensis]|uniref:leucine-rich repeat domain-containing protein n=1 Tax=Taibaiella koreensis TaxID=1268548 RepID=UPI0013C3709B|nr:leucine-rich repeat domain-containing protein [Taibaiella koreensis]
MLIKIPACLALCLSLFFSASAQVVRFPDPAFKQALLGKADTDHDGEIDATEAKKVTKMYLEDTPFTSMEGIKAFSNLEEFGTYKNKIDQVDLSGMTSLKRLYLIGGDIRSINLKGCVNLEHLYLTGNKLKEVDFASFKKLTALALNYNQLTKAEISNFPALKEVSLQENQLSDCRISGCPRLVKLELQKNKLSGKLDLTGFPELEYFDASYNQLASVDIRGLAKLKSFSCLYCALRTINVSGAQSLADIIW